MEIDETASPPKQVFARVTGRARASFTTMEAQRVLRRLGFVCREANRLDGTATQGAGDHESGDGEVDRLYSIEATLATLEAAVAGLHARVRELEAAR